MANQFTQREPLVRYVAVRVIDMLSYLQPTFLNVHFRVAL